MRGEKSKPKRSAAVRFGWAAPLVFLVVITAPLASVAAPIVTIIDDDAINVKAIEKVKKVADRCGIKVTFAAWTASLEVKPKVTAKLREYVAEGHEVAYPQRGDMESRSCDRHPENRIRDRNRQGEIPKPRFGP